MIGKGRAFSGGENDYNRLVGAGFSGHWLYWQRGGRIEVQSVPEGEITQKPGLLPHYIN
jgi:hypothetical protein